MKGSLLCLLLCLLAANAMGQITITDDDLQGNTTYNWSNDQVYLLDGPVVLEEGGILNIEAGTVVKGLIAPSSGQGASALIIAKGARIYARGTRTEPIVFTASIDDLAIPDDLAMEDRGLWGGIAILGRAPIASADTSLSFEQFPQSGITYGGNDEQDNSGELSFVSIRHGGAAGVPDEEYDGLVLGGVGSGTVIDHIEVYACQDDCIEFRGGTVNLKHLSVSFCSDESVDWDLGWRGKGQFWLALQDGTSDRCGEHDGASPDSAEPFSKPIVSNVTYIGPGQESDDAANEALLFRDRSGGIYANSIFINFPNAALRVEDLPGAEDSYALLSTGDLLFNCNYFWQFGAGSDLASLINTPVDAEDPSATALIEMLENTQNNVADPLLRNIEPDPDFFDPRLRSDSPANFAGCPVSDPFFESVNYIGAFGSETVWLQQWSGMAANLFFASILTDVEDQLVRSTVLKIYPNPSQNYLFIDFQGIERSHITKITIHSSDGRAIRQLPSSTWQTEQGKMDVSLLENGIYFLEILVDGMRTVERFVVSR